MSEDDSTPDIALDPEGTATYERILGDRFSKSPIGIRELSINHLFAKVWNRGVLSDRDRSLITIALLAFQGHKDQLTAHVRGAKRRGMSRDEVLELMIHVAHYGGWPSGAAGQGVALRVFDEEED